MKHPWSVAGMPGIRHALSRAMVAETQRTDGLVDRAEAIGRRDMAASLRRSSEVAAHLAERVRLAELYWVTGGMARAALNASQDCPGILDGDMPDHNGIICFADPLPPFDMPGGVVLRANGGGYVEHADPVPVDGLIWTRIRGGLEVHLCCKPGRLPLPLFATPMPLVPFARFRAPLPADFEGLEVKAIDSDANEVVLGGAILGPMALLSTIWVQMMIPTMASRHEVTPEAAGKGRARSQVPPSPVLVIDLRPMRHVMGDDSPGGDGSRHLTTRHVVRGHWTRQRHGHGGTERKIIWISPYVRGPEWAPLVSKDHVFAWRR